MNRPGFFIALFFISLSTVVFAQTQSMQVAGVTRTYIVHAPTGISNPPFMFNIHGFNMSASSEESYTQMDKIADRDKFIVVYPNALPNSSNQQSWDMSGANDFTFLMAIIDTIDKKYKIDRNRIYSCGFSQGGFMSFQLACRYSDIFAAIAPTSGLLNGTCTLKRPLSMRLTFGTNDVATPASFMQSVTTWLNLCNCPKTPVVTRPYPSTNPNSVVTRLVYGPCDQGTEVIADSIRTGQHEWPMNTGDRINNSEETWAFLKRFSLNNTSIVPLQTAPAPRDGITVSCAAGIVRLQGALEKGTVRVIDTRGRQVAVAVAAHHQFAIKNMAGGVYLVRLEGNGAPVTLRLLVP
jgi:poly(hydroxyalkanoate) depolymerase family esterase